MPENLLWSCEAQRLSSQGLPRSRRRVTLRSTALTGMELQYSNGPRGNAGVTGPDADGRWRAGRMRTVPIGGLGREPRHGHETLGRGPQICVFDGIMTPRVDNERVANGARGCVLCQGFVIQYD